MANVFKPRSVRELLTEMKDVSDLMIDLAYATVLFKSDELADRVYELEMRMDELMYNIRSIAAVVTRNIHEARKITGILQVAGAAEAISNAAGELADLVRRRIEIHPAVCDALRAADEKISRAEIAKGSVLAGKRLDELNLPSNMGVWVLALKRKKRLTRKRWIVPVEEGTQVSAGDMLIVKGPRDSIEVLRRMAGVHRGEWAPRNGLPFIRKNLAEMRDLSSVMVDMAYSSILLGSVEIAKEVRELEEKFDRLNYKLWLATLKAAKGERDVARLNSLLEVVKCMERISNAADSIADVVLRKVELHPVFARSLAESDEQIARADVSRRSALVGKSLGELNLWTTAGVYTLMIKREKRYLFNPSKRVRVRAGDSLIVRGPHSGVRKVKKAAGGWKIR